MKRVMNFRTCIFFILILLQGGRAFAIGRDSVLYSYIRQAVSETLKQNYINDQKNESYKNNYIIDINYDGQGGSTTGELIKKSIIGGESASGMPLSGMGITDGTMNDIKNLLVDVNSKTKNINNITYKGVQFYILLLNGVPIRLEKKLPPGVSITDVLRGKEDYENMAIVTGNGSSGVKKIGSNGEGYNKIPMGISKDLIMARKKFTEAFGNEFNQLRCEMVNDPGLAPGVKQPVYFITFVDYLLYWDYVAANNNDIEIPAQVRRMKFTIPWVVNDLKCNGAYKGYDPQVMKTGEGFWLFDSSKNTYNIPENTLQDMGWWHFLKDVTDWLKTAQEQYLNMLNFNLTAAQAIDKTYDCMMAVKTNPPLSIVMLPDKALCECGYNNPVIDGNQYQHPGQNLKTTLFSDIVKLDEAALGMITFDQKIKLLKILSAPYDNESYSSDGDISNLITHIFLSIKTTADAGQLIQILKQPNPLSLVTENNLFGCIDRIVKNDRTDADGKIDGVPYMFYFNNAVVHIFQLANKDLLANPESLINLSDEEFAKKLFVYDTKKQRKDDKFFKEGAAPILYVDEFPAGTTYFTPASFNRETGKIVVSRKTLVYYCDLADGQFDIEPYLQSVRCSTCVGGQNQQYIQLQQYRKRAQAIFTPESHSFDPFELVILQDNNENRRDLVSENINYNSNNKGIFAAPAYLLKYPAELAKSINIRRTNNAVDRVGDIVLTGLSIFLPELKMVALFARVRNVMWVARAAQIFKNTVQLAALVQTGNSLRQGFFNGFGSDKTKFEKLMGHVNSVLMLGYLGAGGVDWLVLNAKKAQWLKESAEVMEEMSKPEVMDQIITQAKNGTGVLKDECLYMLNLRESVEFTAVHILGKSKDWYKRVLEPLAELTPNHPFQKFFQSGYFFDNGTRFKLYSKSILNLSAGDDINFLVAQTSPSSAATGFVEVLKTEANVQSGIQAFELIEKVKVKLPGMANTVETNLIIGRGGGKAMILAHDPEMCNKLVVEVLNKLGEGYNTAGIREGLKNILKNYSAKLPGATTAVKEEQAITALTALAGENIKSDQLKGLLTYIGSDANRAAAFADDIQKYALLDDFAKDGRLLENYVAISKKNYSLFKEIEQNIKRDYSKFYNFMITIFSNENWLELSTYIGKTGEYKKYVNGEVFYRIMEPRHFERLLKGEGIIGTAETFTSPTLEYLKAKKWDGIIVKFQVKPGTLDGLKSRAIINDNTPFILDIFGTNLPQEAASVTNWTRKDYAMFKTEGYTTPTLIETKQVNIGLGSTEALKYFNSNILNIQIVK